MIRWMPGLAALRDYKLSYLPHDLGAGLTLGAVMVPVGLAYGELAGLPLAGLYGSMLPLVAYALLGSARRLIVGDLAGTVIGQSTSRKNRQKSEPRHYQQPDLQGAQPRLRIHAYNFRDLRANCPCPACEAVRASGRAPQ